MSSLTTVCLEDRFKDLHRYIREGRILDALSEFYDEHVAVQENANPPMVGLDANLEREKQFLKTVKEWKGFEVKSFAMGDDVTFYEAVFDFIDMNGRPVHSEQVDVAMWRNGKIVYERFYYDAGGPKI